MSSPADVERFRRIVAGQLGLYFDEARHGFLTEVLDRLLRVTDRPAADHLAALESGRGDELPALHPPPAGRRAHLQPGGALSYDLGANSFVPKPVDFTEFVAAARHLARYWLALNELPRQGTEARDA